MKRRRKKLKIGRIISASLILILMILTLIYFNNIKLFITSKITKYDYETVSVFNEKEILSKVKEHKYSKTLETIIKTEYYNEIYLDNYFNIEYNEDENFSKNINLLLGLGYTEKEINTFYEELNNDSITTLTESKYIKDIAEGIKLDYFDEDKLTRYINYSLNNELDIINIITYVNIGLDNKYYTNVIELEDEDSITAIVNKYHSLSKTYVPSDLESLNSKYGSGKLRSEARKAFEKMCDGAKEDKIYIYGGSGYRSYSYQNTLYNNYIARDGFDEAETYSARPGYSEHQTGLAMDIRKSNYEYISDGDKEFTWLKNNSYKYGFILRYPKGKEKETGYMYEEWHYRYVGVDVATEVYNSGLTYDEFVARNMLKK